MEITNSSAAGRVATDSAIGAAAGVVATVAMTGVMEVAQRVGLLGAMPPWEITKRSLRKTGAHDDVPAPAQKILAAVAHLGFGAAAGALFLAFEDGAHPPGPRVAHAVAYGLGIWAVSYAGWLPALGLMPRPDEDRPGRQPAMVAAHVVFGSALLAAAEAARALEKRIAA